MKTKQFNVSQSRIYPDIRDKYLDYMGERYNMFISDEFMTAINKVLLLESEKGQYFFAPDMYELTKWDIDKRYNAYKTATDSGWLQVDEVRERENMEPLGMNMIKLGLQDVLYDPKTQMLYVPNTNQMHKLGEGGNGEGESK